MLYSDSRYANGYFYKSQRPQDGSYQTTVDRTFPNISSNFFYYDWLEGDRIDLVSNKFYGDPGYWWKIMDFNPEIMDATNIPSGTTLRIPND